MDLLFAGRLFPQTAQAVKRRLRRDGLGSGQEGSGLGEKEEVRAFGSRLKVVWRIASAPQSRILPDGGQRVGKLGIA
jgi:hypothetical protein